ncbi:putative Disease resistance protein [Tripterygium wilfordii]|uniref:Putative Disease resistance protein n=1 Tax=Tripterygium wilfordii TaxID=458696 RepID=A0A7J7C8L4_TRIWF|nr:protein EDS1L-like [Tripterygium wilfordii]XP_038686098.1 protein EDS1L-like [Tripterygium wilfordii]XP_038686099.1 protein EDS1L-like [Tripterygium wilfordii]KAF5730494.1 putative Disease resistance protein [Tripterygium wilfordii]
MDEERVEDQIGIRREMIKKACSMAMKVHKYSEKQYLLEESRNSAEAIFSLPGFWHLNDWYTNKSFGQTKMNAKLFPSLRSIGNDEVALVNEAFLLKFEALVANPSFQKEVRSAISKKRQIVFTGHSSGGATAILATLWVLENLGGANQLAPLCVTFGSPLVGDWIFNHAIRRENWSRYFIHFVMRYDIVPRILLAPLSSVEQSLQLVLHVLNPNSTSAAQVGDGEASSLFMTVMRNASSVTSRTACKLMGSTNLLLETVSSFIELSPYTPSGTYVFCTRNQQHIVITDSEAVLQLLFYSSQLNAVIEQLDIAKRSLNDHLSYQNELQESLKMQNIHVLRNLGNLPLSSDAADGERAINMALNDLGLSTKARLCLRAAAEYEERRLKNQAKIDDQKADIEKGLSTLQDYKTKTEICKLGYYDAFKLSRATEDFEANVKRQELAGIWDEIIEMLKKYELPDGFELRKEWVDLGTRYRRIVEPLDIANYYRHLKNEDTGPYMVRARPRRYRFAQRWFEHASKIPNKPILESCFWAEVEELVRDCNPAMFENVKERILQFEQEVETWVRAGELGKDVFLEGNTFMKWWTTLPQQHRLQSSLSSLMNG